MFVDLAGQDLVVGDIEAVEDQLVSKGHRAHVLIHPAARRKRDEQVGWILELLPQPRLVLAEEKQLLEFGGRVGFKRAAGGGPFGVERRADEWQQVDVRELLLHRGQLRLPPSLQAQPILAMTCV